MASVLASACVITTVVAMEDAAQAAAGWIGEGWRALQRELRRIDGVHLEEARGAIGDDMELSAGANHGRIRGDRALRLQCVEVAELVWPSVARSRW